jgi:hypothetical protein
LSFTPHNSKNVLDTRPKQLLSAQLMIDQHSQNSSQNSKHNWRELRRRRLKHGRN